MGKSAVSICISLIVVASKAFAAELPKAVASYLGEHCTECHDADVSKGDLNLADLKFQPDDGANFKMWQRVFERVRDDEMPPAKKARPPVKSSDQFIAELGKPLLAADIADMAANGRVRSRRLTRTEYEHTLHDLLGIDLPLMDLLPEDPASHGFETVAGGQQLSHHLLARYLDVADLGLSAAFHRATTGDVPFKRFVSPAELEHKGGGNNRGPEYRDGKSISWPMTLQFYGRMGRTTVPADGWYRVTLHGVQAINPGKDGAVWGTLRSGECSSAAPLLHMVGLVEATAQQRDMVFQAWIERGHQLELKPNDATLKRPPSGAKGGNVSYKGRNLAKEGYAGIANKGITIERVHPQADRGAVRRNLFGTTGLEQLKSAPDAAIDSMIGGFARRAFRRPAEDATLAPYRDIAHKALAGGETPLDALRAAYRAMLCSPRFLTFIEEPGRLDDHAIASRLSYSLWVSMPDAELSKLADEGKLHEPTTLAKQVERMLADARARRFIVSFTDQWLKLNEIEFTSPDPRQFRTFDPVLQESMLQETRAYVVDLIARDLGITHLVTSDFTFANGRLVRHYDLDSPTKPGAGLQRVALKPSPTQVRGGLLAQAAVLKVTADGTITSPVVRGVFVNERILGVRIPPPPPGVPAIEPDIRGATSIRDQLDKHRSNESCNACHRTIDPPGFALESFDPIGGWRTKYGSGGKGSASVDSTGITSDGKTFTDLNSWKQIYAGRGDQLAEGFARHFLTYATGAAIRFGDEAVIDEIVARTKPSGHGMRSIIQAAITSSIFLQK